LAALSRFRSRYTPIRLKECLDLTNSRITNWPKPYSLIAPTSKTARNGPDSVPVGVFSVMALRIGVLPSNEKGSSAQSDGTSQATDIIVDINTNFEDLSKGSSANDMILVNRGCDCMINIVWLESIIHSCDLHRKLTASEQACKMLNHRSLVCLARNSIICQSLRI